MRRVVLLMAVLGALNSACIDSFENTWFNPGVLESYSFPNNTLSQESIEELSLRSVDKDGTGFTIAGVWAKQCSTLGCAPTPQNTILYFHGNALHIDAYWDRVMILHALGFDIFTIDYRGFGISEGTSSENSLYEDARTAYAHVLERNGIPPIVYGFSLGTAATALLGVEFDLPGVVLEAPFASGQAIVDDSIGAGLPFSVFADSGLSNVEKIVNIAEPKLIMHGVDDRFIRFEFGEALFEQASEPKQNFWVEGGQHSSVPCPSRNTDISPMDEPCVATDAYNQALLDFINDL